MQKLFKNAFLSYRMSFVQGHYYLDEDRFSKIRQVLAHPDNEDTIKDYEQKMSQLIGQGYGVSFAAGRMAFYCLLKALNIKAGDEVILLGFTCSVMPNAVLRVGAKPIFSDIDIETFGSSAIEIEKKVNSRTKIVVVQHSFGIPCNIRPILEVAKKHNIFVVEDCALAFDSTFDGIKVGNWGDAAIFSTDHTKPLNTLIGGFLYTKNKALYEKVKVASENSPNLEKAHQDRLYNQFLFERKYYVPQNYPYVGYIEKFKSLKKKLSFKRKLYTFFEADYNKPGNAPPHYPYPAKMPTFLAQLGLFELERWDEEKKRRKELLKKYLSFCETLNISKYLPKAYFDCNLDIVPLRFVFTHPDSSNILSKMEKFIDIGATWFRAPIICTAEKLDKLGYNFGDCPISEKAGLSIINWPCILPEKWDCKIVKIFSGVMAGEN